MKFHTLSSKFFKKNKLYGTTVVGTKGQVVIPVQARKDLKIKPGDSLVVIGKMGKALGLVKAEALSELVASLMSHIEHFPAPEKWKTDLRKHTNKILNIVNKKK